MFLFSWLKHKNAPLFLAIALCLGFFIAYSVLSIVRHEHYGSFGYDLGINHQIVWRYSTFQPPITTVGPFPGELKLTNHVELIYALISPLYWIWGSARMLLLIEAFFMCLSGIPIYLLARDRKLIPTVSLAILFSYLAFYGVQNAMWFDVHSASFAAGFISWFFYFLNRKHIAGTLIFLLLALTAKENVGLITASIALVYFISRKDKFSLLLMLLSLGYLAFIFYVFFPFIIQKSYLYQNSAGLLSNLDIRSLVDTAEKRTTIFYSIFSFGFLPLLNPLLLIPFLADLATYFILGSDLSGSHGLYMHYRVTLAPLLAWGAIGTIAKYKKLNNRYVALYLLVVLFMTQYTLHLPLSYLVKSWFWQEPSGVKTITHLRQTFSRTDAIVAQNNILPHLARRDKIYTLYHEKKTFTLDASPCGVETCDWFRWYDHPTYLFIDTSPEWDIRHYLANREDFLAGITNLEKKQVIRREKQEGTTVIYRVLRNPSEISSGKVD